MQLAQDLMDADTVEQEKQALRRFKGAIGKLAPDDVLEAGGKVRDLVNAVQANPEKGRRVAREIDEQLRAIRARRQAS